METILFTNIQILWEDKISKMLTFEFKLEHFLSIQNENEITFSTEPVAFEK